MTQYFTISKPVSVWQYDPQIVEGTVVVPGWVIDECGRQIIGQDGKLWLLRPSSETIKPVRGRIVGYSPASLQEIVKGHWLVRDSTGKITLYSPEQFKLNFREFPVGDSTRVGFDRGRSEGDV